MSSPEIRLKDFSNTTFRDVGFRDARLRGVDADGMDIDAPWLLEEPGRLIVNGVDVAPLVDAVLDERFPGRALRRARTADGLRQAWDAVEEAWVTAVRRAEALPAGSVDVAVDDEWSFAETLRHLVMATDTWLRKAIQSVDDPYHPAGMPDSGFVRDGGDTSVFSVDHPRWEKVLEARQERLAMVRAHLAALRDEDLDRPRANPHAPEHQETVLSCLRTILEEEWEHLRYATRDLGVLEERHRQ